MHHWLGGWTPLFGSWLGQQNCEDFAKNHFTNVHGVDRQSLKAIEEHLNII